MEKYYHELNLIEKQEEAMLSLLTEWVNISSGSTNLKGLEKMRAAIMRAYEPLEPEIEEITLPPMPQIDDQGNLIEVPLGKALRFRKRGNAPIRIFLGGHMDTVFPEETPFNKAEIIAPGVLRGPGAADMKSGLIVMLKALEAFEHFPNKENLGWEVLISSDEEIGSPSSKKLLEESAHRNHLGLVFEPSHANGSIAGDRKGSINFTILTKGKKAHAGRDINEGINAIDALLRTLACIEGVRDNKRGITLNFGIIRGGSAVNVVADSALCQCNIRMEHEEDYHHLKESLTKIIDTANEREAATVSLLINSSRPPKIFAGNNASLFKSILACANELKYEMPLMSTGGVCDGNNLSSYGLPVIDTLGPRGEYLHTFEERVYLDSLVPRAKTCALFLMKTATGGIPLFSNRELTNGTPHRKI